MNKKIKNDLDDDDDFDGGQVFVTVQEFKHKNIHIHLDGLIGDPSYYRKLQPILENTTEADTCLWHLNSPGGSVYTTLPVIHWMNQSDAHQVALIEGVVASAATFFIMNADSVIAMPHSSVMVHGASYGTFGTMQNTKEFVEFQDKSLRTLWASMYEGFFSEEETEEMIKAQRDVWLTGDEVIERLQKRDELQQAIMLAEDDELEEIIEDVKDKRVKKSSQSKPKTTKKEK